MNKKNRMDESTNEKRSSFKNKIAEFCQTAAPVVRHVKEDIHSLVEESKKLVLFSDAEKVRLSIHFSLRFFMNVDRPL